MKDAAEETDGREPEEEGMCLWAKERIRQPELTVSRVANPVGWLEAISKYQNQKNLPLVAGVREKKSGKKFNLRWTTPFFNVQKSFEYQLRLKVASSVSVFFFFLVSLANRCVDQYRSCELPAGSPLK